MRRSSNSGGIAALAAIAAEVAVMLIVADWLGWAWTMVLLAAGLFVGVAVMRMAGAAAFRALTDADARASSFEVMTADGTSQRVQQAPTEESLRRTGRALGDSILIFISGMLWAVPGFITDLFGALLLIPPVRRRVARRWAARMRAAAGPVTVVTAQTVDGVTLIQEETWDPQADYRDRGEAGPRELGPAPGPSDPRA